VGGDSRECGLGIPCESFRDWPVPNTSQHGVGRMRASTSQPTAFENNLPNSTLLNTTSTCPRVPAPSSAPEPATRKDRFVSDTTTESPATAPAGRAGKGLSSMLLPELQAYAVSLGIT